MWIRCAITTKDGEVYYGYLEKKKMSDPWYKEDHIFFRQEKSNETHAIPVSDIVRAQEGVDWRVGEKRKFFKQLK